MEHKCTLTKWDTPHGVIAGQYIPGGNDPENPNIMRCAMTAVIGTTEEYDGSVVVHEVAHAIQYYNTDGRGIRTLLSEGIAAFVERNNDNSKNLINSARSLFDNKALQNYNDDQVLGSVDKIFNVTILKLQRNLERLKRWLGLYQT